MTHHGGILSTFWANWYDMQVKTVQYGAGERGKRSRVHGELVCGPETLSRGASCAKNRCDFGDEIRAHPLDDAYHKARSPQLGQDHGAAVLGRQLGRTGPASARQFRRLRARRLARRNGSKRTASSTGRISTPTTGASCSASSSTISSRARTPAGASSRACCCRCAIRARNSSSAPRANGRSRARNGRSSISTRRDFSLTETSLTGEARVTFDALGDGVTFLTPPLHTETEITGPVAR